MLTTSLSDLLGLLFPTIVLVQICAMFCAYERGVDGLIVPQTRRGAAGGWVLGLGQYVADICICALTLKGTLSLALWDRLNGTPKLSLGRIEFWMGVLCFASHGSRALLRKLNDGKLAESVKHLPLTSAAGEFGATGAKQDPRNLHYDEVEGLLVGRHVGASKKDYWHQVAMVLVLYGEFGFAPSETPPQQARQAHGIVSALAFLITAVVDMTTADSGLVRSNDICNFRDAAGSIRRWAARGGGTSNVLSCTSFCYSTKERRGTISDSAGIRYDELKAIWECSSIVEQSITSSASFETSNAERDIWHCTWGGPQTGSCPAASSLINGEG